MLKEYREKVKTVTELYEEEKSKRKNAERLLAVEQGQNRALRLRLARQSDASNKKFKQVERVWESAQAEAKAKAATLVTTQEIRMYHSKEAVEAALFAAESAGDGLDGPTYSIIEPCDEITLCNGTVMNDKYLAAMLRYINRDGQDTYGWAVIVNFLAGECYVQNVKKAAEILGAQEAAEQRKTMWAGKTLEFVSETQCPVCIDTDGKQPEGAFWGEKCRNCGGTMRLPIPTRSFMYQDSSTVSQCTVCQNIFSLANRKHHCRGCGVVVCSSCSKGKMVNCPVRSVRLGDPETLPGLLTDPKDAQNPQRCCDNCMIATAKHTFGKNWNTGQELMLATSRNFIGKDDARYMPDSEAKHACPLCAQGYPDGKHHCRTCGTVCCGPCSQNRVILTKKDHFGRIVSWDGKSTDRTCDLCLVKILSGARKWDARNIVDWNQPRGDDGVPVEGKWVLNRDSGMHINLMSWLVKISNKKQGCEEAKKELRQLLG